jgi:uncharacterized protein GlcG (DUF336 family)
MRFDHFGRGCLCRFSIINARISIDDGAASDGVLRRTCYQVGVTVVDRFGQPQAYLKNRYAGLHVYDTSRRKAWTAVSFRTSTSALAAQTRAGSDASAIRLLAHALPLSGGLVVYSGEGSIVAGIGVSGAPGPELDEVCAQDGIDAIEDEIAF